MILDKIVERIQAKLEDQKLRQPQAMFNRDNVPEQDKDLFKSALNRPGIQVIAEIKKASPSKGVITEEFDPISIAGVYASAGVAAISVLTEEDFFQGSIKYLQQVRENVSTPILRKDFIIDPYQIYESKHHGANSILLIAGILTTKELKAFGELADELGMNSILEIHDESELEKALEVDADIIGINNRDLKSFRVDLDTTFRLAEKIPQGKTIVSESGIQTRDQVIALEKSGIDAILIGETLMRSNNKRDCLLALTGKN